jgi:hypothetical protein
MNKARSAYAFVTVCDSARSQRDSARDSFAPEARTCVSLIVVRAGAGTWAEAYDNLDLFAAFWVKPKSRKNK